MPLLGKHLGVGVTSIYWYFRKKDDLLNAMTDRALRQYVFATPYVEAKDWRETLRNHARAMRKTFMGNPILCDLILIRSALSPRAAKLGVQEVEKAISSLVEAGLSPEDAFDTYSAVSVHVRGSVVLQRLARRTGRRGGARRHRRDDDDRSGDRAAAGAVTQQGHTRRLRREELRVRPRVHPRPCRPAHRGGSEASPGRARTAAQECRAPGSASARCRSDARARSPSAHEEVRPR